MIQLPKSYATAPTEIYEQIVCRTVKWLDGEHFGCETHFPSANTKRRPHWKKEALFYPRGTSCLVLVLSSSILSLSNSSLSLASFDGS
jgi:hypothetical protein